MSEAKLFWDEGNGRVVLDPEYAPIFRNEEGIYLETYEVWNHGPNMRITIAISQFHKENGLSELVRKDVCNTHGLKDSDLGRLVRLTIPGDKYDELIERYYGEDEEDD